MGAGGAELNITYEMMPVGFSLQRYNLSSYFVFSIHDSGKQQSGDFWNGQESKVTSCK